MPGSPAVLVRDETAADHTASLSVVRAAFGGPAEAAMVAALRDGERVISLVAESAGAVIGHVLFSPVRIGGRAHVPIVGLAPLAVAPARQRDGVGSALVREGLARCAMEGVRGVVVLGHPDYYPRFGFRPAAGFGLRYPPAHDPSAFMALELVEGALSDVEGDVRYAPAIEDA